MKCQTFEHKVRSGGQCGLCGGEACKTRSAQKALNPDDVLVTQKRRMTRRQQVGSFLKDLVVSQQSVSSLFHQLRLSHSLTNDGELSPNLPGRPCCHGSLSDVSRRNVG